MRNELLSYVGEVSNLFSDSGHAKEFLRDINSLRFSEPDFAESVSDADFWKEAEKFNLLFLDLLLKNDLITEEEYVETQQSSAEATTEFVKSVLLKNQ